MTALSTHGEISVVSTCFSSIRVKSGLPRMVRVVPVEEPPSLTLHKVELNIEKYLFNSGPAFLPARTVAGQEISWTGQEFTWKGVSEADLEPPGLTDDDGDCTRVDVRDICGKAPLTLVIQALSELLAQDKIECYGPAERPGREAVRGLPHFSRYLHL